MELQLLLSEHSNLCAIGARSHPSATRSLGLGACRPPALLPSSPLCPSGTARFFRCWIWTGQAKRITFPKGFSVLQIQVSSGWWRMVTDRSSSPHLLWGHPHAQSSPCGEPTMDGTGTSLLVAQSLSFRVAAGTSTIRMHVRYMAHMCVYIYVCSIYAHKYYVC